MLGVCGSLHERDVLSKNCDDITVTGLMQYDMKNALSSTLHQSSGAV